MNENHALFPNDINTEKDVFLGETSVQITGFNGYPSIHIAKSYLIRENDYDDELFYHIFEHKTGTTLINYGPTQYRQVEKFIDITDRWSLFYKDSEDPNLLMPVPNSWRHE
ncbi:hypothetical protein [Halobacillus salinus]|uniref:Uncharacterized protein n=1 Tax=Halobacillus salinus TaxID=192814 RepID=A0A4Z0H2R7_9BACI|nr:hypothetical protein [Halobacillus salinus]TGB04683.1 hypothetical protein E4663_06745 [Halobacillus salinus]